MIRHSSASTKWINLQRNSQTTDCSPEAEPLKNLPGGEYAAQRNSLLESNGANDYGALGPDPGLQKPWTAFDGLLLFDSQAFIEPPR